MHKILPGDESQQDYIGLVKIGVAIGIALTVVFWGFEPLAFIEMVMTGDFNASTAITMEEDSLWSVIALTIHELLF